MPRKDKSDLGVLITHRGCSANPVATMPYPNNEQVEALKLTVSHRDKAAQRQVEHHAEMTHWTNSASVSISVLQRLSA